MLRGLAVALIVYLSLAVVALYQRQATLVEELARMQRAVDYPGPCRELRWRTGHIIRPTGG